ncbi:hypothetical protein FRC12_001570 [Ceratobasidium sp. 428]|nr:hypothetical protein FRC12_001570 [Ceratobasidium sp. 428]
MAPASPNHSESDQEDIPSTQPRPGRTAGARTWQDWENQVVVEKARDHRIWETERTNGGQGQVWVQIATELRNEHSDFNREGKACQSRFNAIMRDTEASLSSEDEGEEADELDEYSKTLREVCRQRKGFQQRRKLATQAIKAKMSADQTTGEKYRLAALAGMVPRGELSNVTRGEGLSQPVSAEIGNASQSRSPSNLNSDLVPCRKRARTGVDASSLDDVISTLEAKDDEYDKELEDVRREDKEQHEELKEKLDCVVAAVDRLADAIDRQTRQTLLIVTNKLANN